MRLLSDLKRGVMTSCKCVGWGGVDHQLAAVSPDTMQRSPPWPLHRWTSLLPLAYSEPKTIVTKLGWMTKPVQEFRNEASGWMFHSIFPIINFMAWLLILPKHVSTSVSDDMIWIWWREQIYKARDFLLWHSSSKCHWTLSCVISINKCNNTTYDTESFSWVAEDASSSRWDSLVSGLVSD